MNPDVSIFQNTIKNLLLAAIKCKNFGAIGPIYENEKNYKYKFNLVDKIVSAAMLIDTKVLLKLMDTTKIFFIL